MDARTVRETVIKPKLVELFGASMATSLITSAVLAGLAGASEQEKLALMTGCICSDPRVLGIWGNARAERQKREWLTLL